MIDIYMSEQLQDSVEILDRLLNGKKWQFLRKTLKKCHICLDFLLCERDELYLQYWRAVEQELGVCMEDELAALHDEWMFRHGAFYVIRADARVGAFLRSVGCHGDFTLRLTLQELRVLEIWQEQYWIEHVTLQLQKIYIARGQISAAESLMQNALFTNVKSDSPAVSFGHALMDSELLAVTDPVFMKCTARLRGDTLRKSYKLAKYFQNRQATSAIQLVH